MSNQAFTEQAFKAGRDLLELQARAQGLLDKDMPSQALALKPEIEAKRKAYNRANALAIAAQGVNLWECVAMYLTGEPVQIRWERNSSQTFGQAMDSNPPVVFIDPDMAENSPASVLDIFLHECGHVVDYGSRDPNTVTKESREARADELSRTWRNFANQHCEQYERIGRTGLQALLLALLDYPIQP